MVGGKTHDYPHGIPFPILISNVGAVIVGFVWVFAVPGHWSRAPIVLGIFFVLALIRGKFLKHYEKTGDAVRIHRPLILTKFPNGRPTPMLLARIAFFVAVAAMVAFGIAPIAESTAKAGIVGCVFVLIGVAAVNIALERHYATTNRATDIDLRSSH